MPFQSDKQKRWMYANEPVIAREWSDRYGAANGGIMDVASDGNTRHDFANFTNGNNINVPTSFQARPQSDPVNLAYVTPQEQGILQTLKPGTPHEGPMGIPNYDSFDAAGGYSNVDTGYSASSGGAGGGWQDSSRADQRANERAEQVRRNYVNKENIRSSPLHKRYNPNYKMGAAKSGIFGNVGIGGLFRTLLSMFGGIPGKALSMLSRINPGKLRGWNKKENRYNTQDEWQANQDKSRDTKRMAHLSDRKSEGKFYNKKDYADLMSRGYSDTFRDRIEEDYASGMNVNEGPFSKNYLQNLDLSKYDKAPAYDDSNYPGIENANFISDSNYPGIENANFISDYNYDGMNGGITTLENDVPSDMDIFNERFVSNQQHLPGLGPTVNTGDPYKDNIYKKRWA